MNKNHNEAVAGTNAFQALVKEFGTDDVYTRIFLEILLEELLLEHSNIRVKPIHQEKINGNKND